MRILIADDDPDNRRLLSILLQRLGHQVASSDDGLEALDLWSEARASGRPFDAALVDLEMPRLGGAGFATRLREAETGGNDTPILLIAVTGCPVLPKRSLGDFDGILGKPYTVEELGMALAMVGDRAGFEAEP